MDNTLRAKLITAYDLFYSLINIILYSFIAVIYFLNNNIYETKIIAYISIGIALPITNLISGSYFLIYIESKYADLLKFFSSMAFILMYIWFLIGIVCGLLYIGG